MTKLQCFVLCRNRYIPAHVPMLPPKKLIRNKFASGILHAWRFALYLSTPIASNPARFNMNRYPDNIPNKFNITQLPLLSSSILQNRLILSSLSLTFSAHCTLFSFSQRLYSNRSSLFSPFYRQTKVFLLLLLL